MANKFSSKSVPGNFPLFEDLLSRLKMQFDEEGNPIQLLNQLQKKREEIRAIKISYLRKKALHNALTQVALNKSKEDKFGCIFSEVQKTLLCAECAQDLCLTPSQTLLGLNIRHLNRLDALSHDEGDADHLFRCLVLPEVEGHLQELCKFIVHNKEGRGQQKAGDKLLKAKALQLPQRIQEDLLALSSLEERLEAMVNRKNQFSHEYIEELMSSLSLLETLVKECRVVNQAQYNRATVEWMRAKYHALALKISVLHNQILIDIYTKENVRALRLVAEELHKTDGRLEQDLVQSTRLLQSYQCMGEDFVHLAASYAQVVANIENEKWALREIEKMQQ